MTASDITERRNGQSEQPCDIATDDHADEPDAPLGVILGLLAEPLDPKLVAHRRGGKEQMVPYIEGYQAINQANRIFGHGRWGAQLVGPVAYRELTRTHKGSGEVSTVGMYWASVRVHVRGCEPRSDVGCAFTADDSPEAHDTAIKAAVTDAMKRALRQYGDQFGNALYNRANPAHSTAGRELADLRAAVLAMGAQLGLDEAATRQHAAKKAGRAFTDLQAGDLARLLRAMGEALGRSRRAA